jgi:hypothetical protein
VDEGAWANDPPDPERALDHPASLGRSTYSSRVRASEPQVNRALVASPPPFGTMVLLLVGCPGGGGSCGGS